MRARRAGKSAETAEPMTKREAELEDQLKLRDERIKQLTADLAEVQQLLDDMREHTEEHDRLVERWIEVFDMEQDTDGKWVFDPNQSELWDHYLALYDRHNKLVREWNKFAPEYNAAIAPTYRGRPRGASEAQKADVLQRRKGRCQPQKDRAGDRPGRPHGADYHHPRE